jgi:hypothetical protein
MGITCPYDTHLPNHYERMISSKSFPVKASPLELPSNCHVETAGLMGVYLRENCIESRELPHSGSSLSMFSVPVGDAYGINNVQIYPILITIKLCYPCDVHRLARVLLQ